MAETTKKREKVPTFDDANLVIAFNRSYKMVALFHSLQAASDFIGLHHSEMSKCCRGERITAKGFYFRKVPKDIIIDIDEDMGNLTLIEYDKELGNDFEIYGNRCQRPSEKIWEHDFDRKDDIIYYKRRKIKYNIGDRRGRPPKKKRTKTKKS